LSCKARCSKSVRKKSFFSPPFIYRKKQALEFIGRIIKVKTSRTTLLMAWFNCQLGFGTKLHCSDSSYLYIHFAMDLCPVSLHSCIEFCQQVAGRQSTQVLDQLGKLANNFVVRQRSIWCVARLNLFTSTFKSYHCRIHSWNVVLHKWQMDASLLKYYICMYIHTFAWQS
jgi:hypothetical protein